MTQTGSLFGVVTDDRGIGLPGATITLSGVGAPQVQVSNDQGNFQFSNLQQGSYEAQTTLAGYATSEYPNIIINAGGETEILIVLESNTSE